MPSAEGQMHKQRSSPDSHRTGGSSTDVQSHHKAALQKLKPHQASTNDPERLICCSAPNATRAELSAVAPAMDRAHSARISAAEQEDVRLLTLPALKYANAPPAASSAAKAYVQGRMR